MSDERRSTRGERNGWDYEVHYFPVRAQSDPPEYRDPIIDHEWRLVSVPEPDILGIHSPPPRTTGGHHDD